MTSHNEPIRHLSWHEVKGKLIGQFKTIKAAAKKFNCHPNSIRNAVEGRSPGIWEQMKKYV